MPPYAPLDRLSTRDLARLRDMAANEAAKRGLPTVERLESVAGIGATPYLPPVSAPVVYQPVYQPSAPNVGYVDDGMGELIEIIDEINGAFDPNDESGAVIAFPGGGQQRVSVPRVLRAQQRLNTWRLARPTAPTARTGAQLANVLAFVTGLVAKERFGEALQPNNVTAVCFDGLNANQTSDEATISSPINGRAFIVGRIMTSQNSEAAVGAQYRITKLDIVGIDFVQASTGQVSYVAAGIGTPTDPGIPFHIFSADRSGGSKADFAPWVGLVFQSDGKIKIKVRNCGTAAGGSGMVSLLCFASPCGDQQKWTSAASAKDARAVLSSMRGEFGGFPRSLLGR